MGVYEVSVSARFVAHHCVGLPDGTREDPHEHDWQVTAIFRGERLDESGFVVDFLAVRAALDEITAELDGTDLNALPALAGVGATAERMAEYLAGWLKQRLGREVHCLRLIEAPGCEAAFYPKGAQ